MLAVVQKAAWASSPFSHPARPLIPLEGRSLIDPTDGLVETLTPEILIMIDLSAAAGNLHMHPIHALPIDPENKGEFKSLTETLRTHIRSPSTKSLQKQGQIIRAHKKS